MLKMLNSGDCISFSDLFSVCLRTNDHLNLKLWIFSGQTASFKIEISKVQDFGNLELSPMCVIFQDNGAIPRTSQALLNITVLDGNDYPAGFLLPGCQQITNRGYCFNPIYTASTISESTVSIELYMTGIFLPF